MQFIESEHCVVMKSLNNNTIIAMDQGVEKIIIAKGIAFAVKAGTTIPIHMQVDKIFSIIKEDTQERYNELLQYTDAKLAGTCTEAIHGITEKIGIFDQLGEAALLSITDHLVFAIERLRRKEVIRNPFIHEIRILYAKEYKVAADTVQWLEENLQMTIPDHEIGFIAIHIHSLMTNSSVSHTLMMDTVIMESNVVIEEKIGPLNRDSLEYVRYITHMRFVMNRLLTGVTLTNELKDVIAERYSISYALAEGVAHIISQRLKKDASIDEIAYIAVHIENLRSNRRK